MTDTECVEILRRLRDARDLINDLNDDDWVAVERAIWALDGGLTAAYDQGLWDGMKARRVGSMSENDNG